MSTPDFVLYAIFSIAFLYSIRWIVSLAIRELIQELRHKDKLIEKLDAAINAKVEGQSLDSCTEEQLLYIRKNIDNHLSRVRNENQVAMIKEEEARMDREEREAVIAPPPVGGQSPER